MLETSTVMRAYDLPADGPPAHQFLIDQIASAKHSLHLFIFGFTDLALVDALTAAYQRGVTFSGLFDHTQSCGPTEVAALHRLWLTIPPANCRITTSPEHQFMHRKMLIVDGEADVPDAQYDSIDAATAAGYPRVVSGSTNWSPTAFEQTNDLLIFPGKLFAQQALAQFTTLWQWADAHEAAYQPKAA